MTDEMRAAEGLVREVAPVGHPVLIPEPLAVDESRWLLAAIERGLIELTSCPSSCAQHDPNRPRRDHLTTGRDEPQHLYDLVDGRAVLRRDELPAIAAWTRAVVELGYPLELSTLRCRTNARAAAHARFDAPDGGVHLLVEARGERLAVRRLATALDASGRLRRLRPGLADELAHVMTIRPAFLWVVGPSTVEPASHVFRVDGDQRDCTFERVTSVPVPV